MKCSEIEFGTGACAYNIDVPWRVDGGAKKVSIDKCLLREVQLLWEMGIKTTGCCCGHGNYELAFIGVKEEHIATMKALGYVARRNPYRPGDEDSFVPKTTCAYGDIQKGFNWWDNG